MRALRAILFALLGLIAGFVAVAVLGLVLIPSQGGDSGGAMTALGEHADVATSSESAIASDLVQFPSGSAASAPWAIRARASIGISVSDRKLASVGRRDSR